LSFIQIETTKLRSTWWVDDILHLQRRRQDQQVPRVEIPRHDLSRNFEEALFWFVCFCLDELELVLADGF